LHVIRHPIFPATADAAALAVTFFVGSGSQTGATDGATTIGLPRDDLSNLRGLQIGDLMVIVIETFDQVAAITSPAGWTEATSSPVTNGSTRLTVFYKRVDDISESDISISDSGDHTLALLLFFRGVIAAGDPFAAIATDTGTSATLTGPGVTTTEDQQFVLYLIASTLDLISARIDNPTNTNLKRVWNNFLGDDTGDGGNVSATWGIKETAGAAGSLTVDQTSGNNATPPNDPQSSAYAAWTAAIKRVASPLPDYIPLHLLDPQGTGDNRNLGDLIQPYDILVAVYETNNDAITLSTANWALLDDFPVSNAGVAPTRLTGFYKRVTGLEEFNPLLKDPGNHLACQIAAISGVIESGDPWDVTDANTGGTGTSAALPSLTTTVNNCLVVHAAANSFDSGTTQFGTVTNAGLTGVGNIVNGNTSQGTGGGVVAGVGVKATAGATGAGSVSIANSTQWCSWSGALKPQAAGVAPSYRAQGTFRGSNGAIQANLPVDVNANEILLLFVETENETTVVQKPDGWQAAPNSPVTNVTSNTRLYIFWKRATGENAYPNVSSSNDHTVLGFFAVRNCVQTGNPLDCSNSTTGSSGTAITIPGDTTTINGCLVVAIAGTTRDASSQTTFQGWANADLDWILKQYDNTTSTGTGGGRSVAVGRKATAGVFGDTTVSQDTAVEWVGWVGAFKPEV
jgi:hypothetical protein